MMRRLIVLLLILAAPASADVGSRAFTAGDHFELKNTAVVPDLPATFACWVRAGAGTYDYTILDVRDDFPILDDHLLMEFERVGVSSTGFVRCQQKGTTTQQVSASATYDGDEWVHVACVFTSDSDRSAYFNGAETNSTASAGATTGLDSTYLAAQTGLADFIGQLCGCGVWGAALTPDEVKELALGAAPTHVRPGDHKEVWMLNESSGNAVGRYGNILLDFHSTGSSSEAPGKLFIPGGNR